MNTLSYKTISANEGTVTRNWYLVDAEDQALGRMSSQIAHILRGKNKPYYTPHVDCGDYIIVINADKVKLTGNKWTGRKHFTHTGYPGGQKELSPKAIFQKKPEAVIENAVKGMLPKNKLGNAMYKKLFVYIGTEHPHLSQKPKKINFIK